MRIWKPRLPGAILLLAVLPLLICSCETTEQDVMGKDDATDAHLAQNRSWIVDSPPSSALDPANFIDYSAYWLGEILLAPVRMVEVMFPDF